MERRGWVTQFYLLVNQQWEEPLDKIKSFDISKYTVWEAYQRVKANKGAAGIDNESIEDFERDLKNNLYKIWNRMSSGSYFPPPVRTVLIPKSNGGTRKLGIPTVGDRIAQTVVKLYLEPDVEQQFHPDSYGYRPGKSAHDAVATARERCWKLNYVIDLDIKGFFDNINHELMMQIMRYYVSEKWILLYVERWLKSPIRGRNGKDEARTQGTPQGGVISPLLANMFLHVVFDSWISQKYPALKWERYADDIIIHCGGENKYKTCRGSLTKGMNKLKEIYKSFPNLFVHWQYGYHP